MPSGIHCYVRDSEAAAFFNTLITCMCILYIYNIVLTSQIIPIIITYIYVATCTLINLNNYDYALFSICSDYHVHHYYILYTII